MTDLVLLNGKILTMDPACPQAQALAAKGDRIVAVGSNADVKPLVSPGAQVIDLEGRLATPGLIDGHGHYMSLGESLTSISLFGIPTWDGILRLVADAVRQAQPGEWIVGRGWHQDEWHRPPSPGVEGLPVHQGLSAVSPNNPVILIHKSGHGVLVNVQGLAEAGITRETDDPPGGAIVRDSEGNPTGMLRETAQQPARDALAAYRRRRPPEVVEAELRRQVQLAADHALANGITSFHDMGESFETIDLLKIMAAEGNLPVRLWVCIQEPCARMESRLARYRMVGYGNNYLTVRAIGERVLDGALGVHGGWLLEPYADKPDSVGFNVTPVAEIERSAELAIEHGYQMAIQGIGDRATRTLLNIYEKNFRRNPAKTDLRWRIEHCQVIHPDDLVRFPELGVIASVRGVFATSDGPWVVDRLGEQRIRERGYQYRTMMESGIVLINGTDPPVEEINPIANFYASVTRKMANGQVFGPEQRLSRQQALQSYTRNPAFAAFEEDLKGSLSPGKLADVTVFTKDIMTLPDDELLSAEIAHTIVGGQVKYSK